MKKQKMAAVFAALLTMTGFTSCLNSKDDGVSDIAEYAEVSQSSFGSVSFNSMYGWVCVPNKSLVTTPESELAYIAYRYEDADLQSITNGSASSKDLPVTLLQDPVYLKRLNYTQSVALPEETKTVSVYALGDKDATVWGYNKYLILAPTIFLKKGTTNENLSTELANHRLSFYYQPDKDDVSAKTLKLYLRYEITGVGESASGEEGDSESWASDYTIRYAYLSYLNLQPIIASYQAAHEGNKPENLMVEYEYSNSAASVPTIANKQTRTVTYKLYKETDSDKQ